MLERFVFKIEEPPSLKRSSNQEESELTTIALHRTGFDMTPRLNGLPGTYATNMGIWIQSIIQHICQAR